MSTIRLAGLVALVALGVSSAATSQQQIQTTNGKTYDGRVLSDDGTSVEFQTSSGTTLRLPYERLTPTSQYVLRRNRTPDDDAAAQLELADWCVDMVLYNQARMHYRNALDADAAMSDVINEHVAAARKQASEEILQRAKDLAASGKEKDARELLTKLVKELPLEAASEEAAGLLAEDTLRRKEAATAAPVADSAGADAASAASRPGRSSFSDETIALLTPSIEHYKKMLDETQAGLLNKNQSGAIKDWEKAIKEGEKSLKEGEKVGGRADGADEIARAIAKLESLVAEASVDAWIHMTDNYIFRGSEKQANDVIQEGLARYPNDPKLLAARQRVAMAASNHDRGWVMQLPSGGGGRQPLRPGKR